MSRNDDYTTGNLLDYTYHPNYYKLISITRRKQWCGNVFYFQKSNKEYSKHFFKLIKRNRTIEIMEHQNYIEFIK